MATANYITGQGDITNPESWIDADSNVPPAEFGRVPDNLNYPLNGDGRYWWSGNFLDGAVTPNGYITFHGDLNLLIGSAALSWQVAQFATDGSIPYLEYSTDDGGSYTTVNLPNALQSGAVNVQLGQTIDGITSTAGTPAIFTAAGSNFAYGTKVYLSGALPDGFTASLPYYVVGGTTDTFELALVPGGIAIASDTVGAGITVTYPCAGLKFKIDFSGGTTQVSPVYEVAVAVTRNADQAPVFNYPDPITPANYNPQPDDFTGYDTLQTLQGRLLIRLGFAAQQADPPPGMAALLTEFLQSAQNWMYWRYPALRTRRLFRWKLVPGQRFYSIIDNDDDASSGFTLNPNKTIEWAGMQDNRNVWYPLIEGIPPSLYTMIAKPWRPARYEIRQSIEVYPAPDQTYWMWIKGHFGLQSFSNPTDQTTIDSELVFLWALAKAKAHYGAPDAGQIQSDANVMLGGFVAGTHQTKRYVPGSTPVPPAVRPTLISYDGQ